MVSNSPVKRPLPQTKPADGLSLPDWLKWLLFVVASYFQFHGWDIALWSKVEMSYLCQDRGLSFNSSCNIELTVPVCRVENEVSKSKGQALYSVHSCCHRHWCYWCSTVCQANWQPCRIRFLSWLSVTMYMKHSMKKDVSFQAAQLQPQQKWVIFVSLPVCICHISLAYFWQLFVFENAACLCSTHCHDL